MTRKDYKALAKALRKVPSQDAWETWWPCVTAVADVLAEDNPEFDRDKFYTACGVVVMEERRHVVPDSPR